MTLRAPPPLDEPLELDAERSRLGRPLWSPKSRQRRGRHRARRSGRLGDAVAAEQPDLDSPFPQCFVCGHARGADATAHPRGPGARARTCSPPPWRSGDDSVGPEFVWSALDCPGAYATGAPGRGRRRARPPRGADRPRAPGGRALCRRRAALGSEGRKHAAGTAVSTARRATRDRPRPLGRAAVRLLRDRSHRRFAGFRWARRPPLGDGPREARLTRARASSTRVARLPRPATAGVRARRDLDGLAALVPAPAARSGTSAAPAIHPGSAGGDRAGVPADARRRSSPRARRGEARRRERCRRRSRAACSWTPATARGQRGRRSRSPTPTASRR